MSGRVTGLPAMSVARAPRTRRVARSPRHEFNGRTFPFCIQPIAIAPVLPNETLTQLKLECRVKTDPLADPFLGWWVECHVFYVKHRDIDAYRGNTNFQDMMLQPDTSLATASVAGGATATYRLNGRADITRECLDTVVNWWFRAEGEAPADFVNALNGLPLARVSRDDWTDSLVKTSTVSAVDFDVDIDNSGTVTASEIDASMQQYYALLQTGALVNMTYEDWLGTYGVRKARVAVNRPELVRSYKKWTQPTNTVTQGTGAVTSACVWTLDEDLLSQKQYYFKEPGYLLAVMVAKPKIYRRPQPGAAVNVMVDARHWLPANSGSDQLISLIACDTVSGPLPTMTVAGGYTFDVRDLLVRGDQFLFSSPSVAGGDSVAAGAGWTISAGAGGGALSTAFSPTTALRPDYMAGTLGSWGTFFAGAGVAGTTMIQAEGYIRPTIQGSVVDLTPGVPIRA